MKKNRLRNSEEGFYYCGDDDKEYAAAKPGGCDFTCIMIPMIPFLVDFYRADETEDSADGVHQVCSRREISIDESGCFVNPGIAICRLRANAKQNKTSAYLG